MFFSLGKRSARFEQEFWSCWALQQKTYFYYILRIKIWYTKISNWLEVEKKLSWSANYYYFQVDWAEPEHEVDEETMSTVKVKDSKKKIYLYSFTLYYFRVINTFSMQRKKSSSQYFCFRSSLLETWCCQPQKQLCANCSIDSATMRWKYLCNDRFSANNANFQVERVKKAKDYAFVHFSSREAAERALAASKGLVIDEADVRLKKLKADVRL